MATLKARSRAMGRKIRKETGLKLPIAMGIAKRLVRGSFLKSDFPEKLQEVLGYRMFGCGADCCGADPILRIFGPKTDQSYGISVREFKA